MNPELEILNRLLDANLWPRHSNSRDIEGLEELAKTARAAGTIEGNLSYMLIMNQVAEAYVKLLIQEAWFAEDLCLVVRGFGTRTTPKRVASLDGLMFGRLLNELSNAVPFRGKSELLTACRSLNERRNKIAHELATRASARHVAKMAHDYEHAMAMVIDAFNDGDDHFTWFYALYLHDPTIDLFISRQIQSEPDKATLRAWRGLRRDLKMHRTSSAVSALRGKTKIYAEAQSA